MLQKKIASKFSCNSIHLLLKDFLAGLTSTFAIPNNIPCVFSKPGHWPSILLFLRRLHSKFSFCWFLQAWTRKYGILSCWLATIEWDNVLSNSNCFTTKHSRNVKILTREQPFQGNIHPRKFSWKKDIKSDYNISAPWIVAESPSRRMISPIRLSCPTRTNSYIAAPPMPSATTTGPDT